MVDDSQLNEVTHRETGHEERRRERERRPRGEDSQPLELLTRSAVDKHKSV